MGGHWIPKQPLFARWLAPAVTGTGCRAGNNRDVCSL
jgi:hypothetical protein